MNFRAYGTPDAFERHQSRRWRCGSWFKNRDGDGGFSDDWLR